MLNDLRVVELGVWVAGPSAAGILADWGADVIKIEAPEGDPMRRVFALLVGHGQSASPPFDLDNRGKRSVQINLGTTGGQDLARRLIAGADVFLTNLRPDAVERFGLGPARLLTDNERLVYAQLTGYGTAGPDRNRAGYDIGAFWARSGIASATAPEGEEPPSLRGGLGDHVAGLATLSGILGALLERERTGRGQVVETSLLRTGIYCLGWDLGIQLQFDKVRPTDPRQSTMNPMVNCYRAADGDWFWLLGVESQRHFPVLCRALGRDDLIDDARFAEARARRHNAEELIVLLDETFTQRTRGDWAATFDEHGVWWAPVNTLAEVPVDPQAVAAGAFVDVPGGAGSPAHRAVATPVTFSSKTVGPSGPVPAVGEHTVEVLRELGLTSDDIDRLTTDGALG